MRMPFCASQEALIRDAVKRLIVAKDKRATSLIFHRFHNAERVTKNSVPDRAVGISGKLEAVFEYISALVGGTLGRKALEPETRMPSLFGLVRSRD